MSGKVICMVILLFPFLINAQVDKTRVLILGTSHLHQIEGFEPFMLDNVIAKLDAFNFDVIGIEKMPGELLNDIKSRQDTAFDEITEGFGASYIALARTDLPSAALPFAGKYHGLKEYYGLVPRMQEYYDYNKFKLLGLFSDDDIVFVTIQIGLKHSEKNIILCE